MLHLCCICYFQKLFDLREKLCKELGLERKNVELSMGMSADYEDAVSSKIKSRYVHVNIYEW